MKKAEEARRRSNKVLSLSLLLCLTLALSRSRSHSYSYPVVIINWVHYLGPPGPFSFPDSRDPLEVLGGLPWQRERGGGLGDPPGP